VASGGGSQPDHEFQLALDSRFGRVGGTTSLAILALESGLHPSATAQRRIDEGRGFLLRRMCTGGGWNHGSVRALGYESTPYPETTGMALAALRGVRSSEIEPALHVADRFLSEVRSADALNWLRIGLMARRAGLCPPAPWPADAAELPWTCWWRGNGTNFFWR
jgi:hypothetical protein